MSWNFPGRCRCQSLTLRTFSPNNFLKNQNYRSVKFFFNKSSASLLKASCCSKFSWLWRCLCFPASRCDPLWHWSVWWSATAQKGPELELRQCFPFRQTLTTCVFSGLLYSPCAFLQLLWMTHFVVQMKHVLTCTRSFLKFDSRAD